LILSLHPLLLRQLRKVGWSEGASLPTPEQWNQFLQRVSRTYIEADQERYLLNRSQELASRETEETCLRLSEAQHIAGLGNWVFDIQHDTGQWSDGCISIFGMSCTSLAPAYSEFLKCIYYVDRERFVDAVGIALETGNSFEIELRVQKENEDIHWIHAKVQPATQSPLTATRIHGTVMDITERKKAEEALRDSELNLRQAQEAYHIGSWACELNGRMTWSDETYKIFGISPEAFAENTQSFIKLLNLDDQADMQAWIELCFAGKDSAPLLFRIIKVDGSVLDIEARGALQVDAEGKPHHLSGTFQDITERKRVEEELQLAKFVMDNAPISINYLDSAARICYINQSGCETLGYTQKELLRLRIPDIDPFYPIDVWAEHWEDLKVNKSIPVETQHRRKNGEIYPVEVRANYVKFGAKEYNVAFVWDISERKKIETDLRIAATAFESQECLMITDADGTILRINHAFSLSTGYTAEEIIGKKPSILKSGSSVKSVGKFWLG
jgi:PAS domain S-box-containing protein